MSIRFKCAECGSSMKIKDELAGTQGKCPKCKTEFIVPAAEPAEPVEVAAAATVEEKTEPEDPEDEYQRILMGDSPRDTGPRHRGIDSDAFISTDSADDHPRAEPPPSETEIKSTAEPAAAKRRSSAEISAMLMKNSAEPTMKKSGKAFGDTSNDKEGARAKLNAATRSYFVRQVGLIAGGTLLLVWGLYALSSSMMGGAKYPSLGRVSGVVTLDGNPIAGANVTFTPMSEGVSAKPKDAGSAGTTDKNGHYVLYYVKDVQGAVLGKHFVQVRKQADSGPELIPGKYNLNSLMTLEVKSGHNPQDLKLTTN